MGDYIGSAVDTRTEKAISIVFDRERKVFLKFSKIELESWLKQRNRPQDIEVIER